MISKLPLTKRYHEIFGDGWFLLRILEKLALPLKGPFIAAIFDDPEKKLNTWGLFHKVSLKLMRENEEKF